MIVADTGAVLALLDRNDRHHEALKEVFEADPDAWVLPWAILPEVDYLAAKELGTHASGMFLDDLADGAYQVEWGQTDDLTRAREICRRYRSLKLGLVDGTVMAIAERHRATAIATVDMKHFGAVQLKVTLKLFPRDL